jgi:hypothetical protein
MAKPTAVELIDGPHFTVDAGGASYSVACGGCGGGAWFDYREQIAPWVREHAGECMADILDEELPEDDEDDA